MRDTPLPEAATDTLAEAYRVLGHATRLRLLDALLLHGELAVGELESLTATVQPALSQQLGILRKAGFVTTRRAAKQVYYQVVSEAFGDLAGFIALLAGSPGPSSPLPPSEPSRRFARGSAATFAEIL